MARTATKRTAKSASAQAAKQTTAPATEQAAKAYIVIDHPKNNEVFGKGHYAFRIGASKCDKVEISIDDQPWHSCRHTVGYWWFDWSCHVGGTHQAVARLHNAGETLVSRRRRFKIS